MPNVTLTNDRRYSNAYASYVYLEKKTKIKQLLSRIPLKPWQETIMKLRCVISSEPINLWGTPDFSLPSIIIREFQNPIPVHFECYLYIWVNSCDYGTFCPPKNHSSNAHAQPSGGARYLIFGPTFRLLPYFMCANSDGSGRVRGCAGHLSLRWSPMW